MKQFYFIFGPKNHYIKFDNFFEHIDNAQYNSKKTLVKMNMFKITCPLCSLIEQGGKKIKVENFD